MRGIGLQALNIAVGQGLDVPRQLAVCLLRFWNDDVERNIDGVCEEILRAAGRGSFLKRALSLHFDG